MTPTPIDDGEPAFPQTGNGLLGPESHGGMSLRAYFAGQAMAGLCASGLAKSIGRGLKDPNSSNARAGKRTQDLMARLALQSADALIAALKETTCPKS